MHIQNTDMLTIQPSASKPSLLSSFWSIHVQAPPLERLDYDMKSCSQNSLPYAFDARQNQLRTTKSMSDLTMEAGFNSDSATDTGGQVPPVDNEMTIQENMTSRVTAWLTKVEITDTSANENCKN